MFWKVRFHGSYFEYLGTITQPWFVLMLHAKMQTSTISQILSLESASWPQRVQVNNLHPPGPCRSSQCPHYICIFGSRRYYISLCTYNVLYTKTFCLLSYSNNWCYSLCILSICIQIVMYDMHRYEWLCSYVWKQNILTQILRRKHRNFSLIWIEENREQSLNETRTRLG